MTTYSAPGMIHILGAKGIIYISAVMANEFYSHLSLQSVRSAHQNI